MISIGTIIIILAQLWGFSDIPSSPRVTITGGTVKGKVTIQTVLTSVTRTRGRRYRTRGQTEEESTGAAKIAPEVTSVVVYLEDMGNPKSYPPPSKPAQLIQKNTQFLPHVLPILKGTKVEIINKDDFYHNVFSNEPAKRFNIGRQVKNAVVTEVFETSAFIPIFCDVHLDMSSYVVVLDNPYFTRPSEDGSFEIPAVPPGRYRVLVWHERLVGQQQEVTVQDGSSVSVSFTL